MCIIIMLPVFLNTLQKCDKLNINKKKKKSTKNLNQDSNGVYEINNGMNDGNGSRAKKKIRFGCNIAKGRYKKKIIVCQEEGEDN